MLNYVPQYILDTYPVYDINSIEKEDKEIGQIYGNLIVLYRTLNSGKNNTIINFLTQCSCGEYRVVGKKKLHEGKVLKCKNCVKRENFDKIKQKEIGKRYGNVIVIDYYQIFGTTLDNKPRYYATIQCDCGEIEDHIEIARLRNKEVTCCYKHRRTKENLIGKTFDYLTVINKAEKKEQTRGPIWICKCKCGKGVIRTTRTLKNSEHFHSCGCTTFHSKGELKIINLLTENNIPFITQKTFPDCISNNKRLYYFDFYINNSFVLEFDGAQHYGPVELFGGEEGYLQRKENDLNKNNYCFKNNIPIKRVPYWDLEKLTIEDILSDKYLLNKMGSIEEK